MIRKTTKDQANYGASKDHGRGSMRRVKHEGETTDTTEWEAARNIKRGAKRQLIELKRKVDSGETIEDLQIKKVKSKYDSIFGTGEFDSISKKYFPELEERISYALNQILSVMNSSRRR